MSAMPIAPHPDHDLCKSLPLVSNLSTTGTEFSTVSELSLPRALNSLLPPSLRAAEIHSFKPKPELGLGLPSFDTHTDSGKNKSATLAGDNRENNTYNGHSGSITSLQLYNATHLPPRETSRRLATRLNMCLGITFFIVESSSEVENLVDRVYRYHDYYNAARQRPGNGDSTRSGYHDAGSVSSDFASSMATGEHDSERLPQPPTTGEICELLAMVAVGSQYDQEASHSLRQACFHSARFGLDDAIEEAEETDAGDDAYYRVLRLLALIAVYQILEKRGSCWRYIGTALTFAKAKGLDRYDEKTDSSRAGRKGSPEGLRVRMRRLWGTLICLESWIGATLGKPPTTRINLVERIRNGDPVFFCREDNSYPALHSAEDSLVTRSLQTALVRIAILTAAIQCSIYPPTSSGRRVDKPVDLVQARFHMAALSKWFETLPPSLHLSVLLGDATSPLAASARGQAIAIAERSSMLLGHCLYLSAMMLLTRHIFLSVVNDPDGGYDILHRKGDTTILTPEKKEALDFVSSCLMAANATGRIMGLLVSEDRLVSKCWMAIYPAFNACLLLLFHLTQRKVLCGETVAGAPSVTESDHLQFEDDADTVETTENAKKCLAALEFCASGGDDLSKWYLQVLAPFRKVLAEPVDWKIRRSVDDLKGDVGQPGFNLVRHAQDVATYPKSILTAAPNVMGDYTPTLRSGVPTPTVIPHTAVIPQINSSEIQNPLLHLNAPRSPAGQCPPQTFTDVPASLSSHILNILTVSAQCAFCPDDTSRDAITGTVYSGTENQLDSQPSAAPRSGSRYIPDFNKELPTSLFASQPGTPLSSTPLVSISSTTEAPHNILHSSATRVHSRTRMGHDCGQEHEGRLTKRPSSQSLQPGEEVVDDGGAKRQKLVPYTGFGSRDIVTQEDLVALLKRAA